jgi:hypothetical protein
MKVTRRQIRSILLEELNLIERRGRKDKGSGGVQAGKVSGEGVTTQAIPPSLYTTLLNKINKDADEIESLSFVVYKGRGIKPNSIKGVELDSAQKGIFYTVINDAVKNNDLKIDQPQVTFVHPSPDQ